MPSADEITRHHDSETTRSPWVHGPPAPSRITIVQYDESWPDRFLGFAEGIRLALGNDVRELQHVGSTAVPGLAAKDVIDIDLTINDPTDEPRYVPALIDAGWRHVIREPWWHEHRCFSRLEGSKANLHVFGPDCPETIRHRMFRDWLRGHPEDQELYVRAKLAAIPGGGRVMDYNSRKQHVVREIYDRIFRAAGLLG